MAVSPNAYATYSANSDYTNPIIWSPESEKYIYERAVFQQFGVNDPRFLNKPGRQGNYTLENGYSMGLLTEGVATPISELSFNQVTINFYAYGDAKQVTDEEIATGFSYILGNIKYGAMGAMGVNRDSVIVTELLTTSSTGIYSNGKNSGNISANDTFNTDIMANVMTAMEESQARECKAIVVHPRQMNSLRKLEQFTDASKYGSDAVIKSGQIGDYLGIPIVSSNNITTASENSITVYKAIALGNRPFVYAQKRNFEFNFERERLRDRAVTASWWEMFGVSILKNDSVIVLTSAGGY